MALSSDLFAKIKAFQLTPLIVPGAFGTLAFLYIIYTLPALLFCSTIR